MLFRSPGCGGDRARSRQCVLVARSPAFLTSPDAWNAEPGLYQALAATNVFYGTDLTALNLADTIVALDASPTLSSNATDIPSLIVRLDRATIVGQPIENLVTASGLLTSKSATLFLPRRDFGTDLLVQLKLAKLSRLGRFTLTAFASPLAASSASSRSRTSSTVD